MRKNARELVNMLAAAVFVLLLLFLAWGIHACRSETVAPAVPTPAAPAGETAAAPDPRISYALPQPPIDGPLSLAASDRPQSDAELAATVARLVPCESASDEDALWVTPGVLIRPEVLLPLARLARGFRAAFPSGALTVTGGFCSSSGAADSTGFALTLTVRTDEGDAPMTGETREGKWMLRRAADYGFWIRDTASPGRLLYVGTPHARMMTDRGLAPAAYIAYIKTFSEKSPLTDASSDGTHKLFYLAADADGAVLWLLPGVRFTYTPVDGGYLVVVYTP